MYNPLQRLLQNANWTRKFSLIGLLALIVTASLVALATRGEYRYWHALQSEQAGLRVFDPTLDLLLLMQQHRGISAGALGGNAAMRDALAAKSAETVRAASAFSTAVAQAPADWGLEARAAAIVRDWEALRTGGGGLPAAENFARHTALVNALLQFIRELNQGSGLAFDADPRHLNTITALTTQMPEVTERLGRLRGAANGILAARTISEPQKEALAALSGELGLTWSQMRSSLEFAARGKPEEQARFDRFAQAMDAATQQARTLASQEVLSGRFGIEPAQWWKTLTDTISLVVDEGRGHHLPVLHASLGARAASAWTTLLLVSALSGLGMLLLLGGLHALRANLDTALRALNQGTRALSEGDFTHRITLASRDELGRVATDFNLMCERMESALHSVQHEAHRLQETAASLTSSASRVSQDAELQSSSAASMAAAVEEMSVSLGEISHHASTTEQASCSAREQASESTSMVNQVLEEIGNIGSVVDAAATAIRSLGQRSEEIVAMISEIREIADQTNLLALNAAIEAARAGEQGRGFAVVADEVRKLAERTTLASSGIVRTVEAIRRDTQAAITGVERGVACVRQGRELGEAAGARMQDVSSNAERTLASVAEIGSALREHSSTNESVAQNVETIARMAEQLFSEVRQTADTAGALNTASASLLRTVDGFRVGAR
ncbi:MAG: methyl-accepting chemotaxis protein [Candidatus Dactylopiibacterium sp.]|nr:methyl-accepting chemotaxis protein [Candidatus Dactylopiibacterium sp.]